MNISVSFARQFEIEYKRYKKKFRSLDSDLKALTDNLAEAKSDDLGNGIYKYRLAVKSKNTGKSGGFRVITLEVLVSKTEKKATLLILYDKSEKDSISKQEIESILKNEGLI